MKIVTNSYEETQKMGEDFAQKLTGGDVILLYGDLGAGKTTFMQGLAKGLGIKRRIISPTFIIVRKYEVPGVIANEVKQTYINNEIASSSSTPRNDDLKSSRQARTINTLYHIDLYRVSSEDDLKGLGFPEILQEKGAVVAIEWAEKLGTFLPKNRWELHFETLDEDTREIAIEKK